jgi:HEAT repeat protein
MLRTLTSAVAALLLASAALAAPPTSPTKSPASKATQPTTKVQKQDLARWQKSLESGSEAELTRTLDEISALGPDGAPAAPLVDAVLTRGANTKVLLSALEAERQLAVKASSDAVAPYVSHRNEELRHAAARTLAQTGGPLAVTTLRHALTGPDPALRGIAAAGLGNLGATEAVEDLFTVLSHDTSEAAVSIARLCAPEQCDRLMALVGKLKFEVLEASFVPLLLRPSSAVPEANKLRYIDRLRRLATRGAAAVLQTTLAQLPKDESPAVRAALQSALRTRPVVGDSK